MKILRSVILPRSLFLLLFAAGIVCFSSDAVCGQRQWAGAEPAVSAYPDAGNEHAGRSHQEKNYSASILKNKKSGTYTIHTGGIYHIDNITKYFESDGTVTGNGIRRDILERVVSQTGTEISKSIAERFLRTEISALQAEDTFTSDTASGKTLSASRFFIDRERQFANKMQRLRFAGEFHLDKNTEAPEIGLRTSLFDHFEDLDDDDGQQGDLKDQNFQWRPAINQSLLFLGIQHGYALALQEKTRRALREGNFFGDYWLSLKSSLKQWDDGNRFTTNYVAHPMQGSLTGFIYLQNNPRSRTQRFGGSKEYWNDRFKAFLWSTAWSTQFELGPISQSSIGNVGMYGKMGWVDLVVTPTVGTAWLITEEAIDRFIIRRLETKGMFMKIMSRMFLNPTKASANLLRFKEPWYREDR